MFKFKLNVHICQLTRREGITLLASLVVALLLLLSEINMSWQIVAFAFLKYFYSLRPIIFLLSF